MAAMPQPLEPEAAGGNTPAENQGIPGSSMSSKEHIECSILFADIAGSARLYEDLGDQEAQEMISRCLTELGEAGMRHGGAVIKTIGDEIMLRFASADDAFMAACTMQESMGVLSEETTLGSHSMSVHIGFHFGSAILEKGDVYGDAVNIAARMTDVARSQQIITTKDTVERLSEELSARTRKFDTTRIKGKPEDMVLYEALWTDDVTGLASTAVREKVVNSELSLRFGDKEQSFDRNSGTIVIGRGKNCDFSVSSKLASRQHARIDYRRGKFVLIDQSTNGTYVRTQDGKEVYLRREELPLWGSGVFSLGQSLDKDEQELVYFLCV
jgi:class 3 adenylate cyclase